MVKLVYIAKGANIIMSIRKSTLLRGGVVALAAIVVGALLVNMAQAAAAVTILTPPSHIDANIYYDQDHDGVNDPEEFVGIFDVYAGDKALVVSWGAYTFPEGANGSYAVSVWQNRNPLGAPSWQMLRLGHHWASNPNGTVFSTGPFAHNEVCGTCPTRVIVQPETFVAYYNPTTRTYEYKYAPIGAAYSATPANLTESDTFVIETVPESKPAPAATPAPTKTPGNCVCEIGTDFQEICDGQATGATCFPPNW